jgi:Predicted metal-dependent hydrolase of the TIM-barrel fold
MSEGLVDHHVHLYPAEVNRDPAGWAAARGEHLWAKMCARKRRDGSPVQEFPDVEELLRAMDAAGIARAVLLGWYWEKAETCEWQNRAMGRWVAQWPDRLAAYATFHPGATAEEVRAELWRARDEGLSGLGELSPHSVGASIDGEGMRAALALAEEWRWPVTLHVTEPRAKPYPGMILTPESDFRALAKGWPRVRFVLAHWAGGFDVRDLGNVFVDTAAAPLIYGGAAWAMRGVSVRPEQVLFGSDYPLRLRPGQPAAEGWAAFAEEARRNGV